MLDGMERKEHGSVVLDWEATVLIEEKSYLREIKTCHGE